LEPPWGGPHWNGGTLSKGGRDHGGVAGRGSLSLSLQIDDEGAKDLFSLVQRMPGLITLR